MNDTLGFSPIVTAHIQKRKGLMPIYICELTFTLLIVTRPPYSSFLHAYSILLKSLAILLASAPELTDSASALGACGMEEQENMRTM